MKRFVCMLLVAILCVGNVSVIATAQQGTSKVEVYAQELKELGLFKGVSETDFALGREPSRVEALVMLIRVLGKESEVNGESWKHPFTDVPTWANNYVGYAYSKGLTNGSSATLFGTGNASAAMYLTFVLRALGYSDANGKDFTWDNPFALARKVGILNDGINTNKFLRADVVLVSHLALCANVNGTQQTLAQKLILADVFTQNKFDSVYNKGVTKGQGSEGQNAQNKELTAEEVYAKCASAVFYIEVFDSKNNGLASGSGFFINSDGVAVTNYHVIEGAYSASIQLSDTKAKYKVLGVYDYNKDEDWAIVKIDCKGNKHLELDATKTSGGQRVYAIGSPLGLQNTISEGIVSNPERAEGKVTYIQTNAAISPGSSGGALINAQGKVIGITSAGYINGQNLNLALPISYINGYKSSEIIPLISIITGSKKSIIKEYDNYSGIPDYGAYNAVSPYKEEKESAGFTTFYYSYDSLKSANTYGMDGYNYGEMLKEWGFEGDIVYRNDKLVTEYKCETGTQTLYVYLNQLSSYGGVSCVSVTVCSETKKPAKGYANAPNVPDFGEYFNVNPTFSSGITGLTSYYYSQSDLYNKGVIGTFFETYWKLLESWGFEYVSSSTNDSGTIYTFENVEKEISINYSAYDGDVAIIIWNFIL